MSLKYIYNNITKYKGIDKDTNENIQINIMYRKKNNRLRAKIIKEIAGYNYYQGV